MILVLHNIRSVHNVGSIFRTADAAGVSRIILSGYTPLPVDRFKKERADFAKVALGAQHSVPWSHTTRLNTILMRLRREGVALLALEQSPASVSLFAWQGHQPIALILGNEVRGLSPQILKGMDHVLEIPMHGSKESLNVSVAAGIALFTLRQALS